MSLDESQRYEVSVRTGGKEKVTSFPGVTEAKNEVVAVLVKAAMVQSPVVITLTDTFTDEIIFSEEE